MKLTPLLQEQKSRRQSNCYAGYLIEGDDSPF